jgi:putative endonuclease
MKTYYVYMMTNRSRVVLYPGITNSLERRLWFHSNNNSKRSFTKRYKVDRLVYYYESFDDPRDAISREKEIKGWRRGKKNDLVRRLNPKWEDLAKTLFGDRRGGPSLRSG